MNLTDEQMRIAIAEACGWRRSNFHNQWLVPREPKESSIFVGDPLNDLNAMHEAEKLMSDQKWDHYQTLLLDACGGSKQAADRERDPIHATACQRAIAFIQTLETDSFN